MDELLPVLSARLKHRWEAVPIVHAALRGAVAMLPLDEAPEADGPHALDLHVPGLAEPLLLLAEPMGAAKGGKYPLLLKPFAPFQEGVLIAFITDEEREADLEAPLTDPAPRMPAPPVNPLIGRVVGGGKYEIEALLGSGGMGSVYLARHLSLQQARALKVLHPSYQHDAKFMASFQREALAASRLDHPNVVRVYDFGQEPDGMLYIVMEVLKGKDLRAALVETPVQPLARVVDVMSQVCAALSASHDQDVVHRDVKPDNILLVQGRDDDGTVKELVKVCDFGIAEISGGADEGREQGRATVSGTPDYISPEQARAETLDARSDLYACGVVLYEMATGRVPFAAAETAIDIVQMHLDVEPPAPSSVNPAIDKRLEKVILKAMSKDREQRHQTARQLRAELRALLEAPKRSSSSKSTIQASNERSMFPPSMKTSMVRADAIDVDHLFSLDGEQEHEDPEEQPREQAWILGEAVATALIEDPEPTLAVLDTVTDVALYAREVGNMERALAALLQRGAPGPLAAVIARLTAHAGGADPGDKTREGLAAKVLRTVEKPELLGRIADQVLDAPPPMRDAARRGLVAIGAAGAQALCEARGRVGGDAGFAAAARPRFVAAMREIGAPGLKALATALEYAAPADAALLEDLLRAVPEVNDDRIGNVAAKLLRHDSAAVRRAAVAALAAAMGSRANAWLAPLIEEPDDGLRMAALTALRRGGGIDRDVVKRIERLLNATIPAGEEARAAGAAALADTIGPARASAIDVLTNGVRPPDKRSFFSKLVSVEAPTSELLVVTMARVLVAIGGQEGARMVEARAAHSTGELRRQLQDLGAGPRTVR